MPRDSHLDSYLDRSPRQNAITGLFNHGYTDRNISLGEPFNLLPSTNIVQRLQPLFYEDYVFKM
jgi:hypothetical protein